MKKKIYVLITTTGLGLEYPLASSELLPTYRASMINSMQRHLTQGGITDADGIPKKTQQQIQGTFTIQNFPKISLGGYIHCVLMTI